MVKKSPLKAVPASWATEKLTHEDEAELRITVRAAHDLLEFLGAPGGLASFVAALIEQMAGSALCRAKPNRRAAYLDQWRQFICCLPDLLRHHPAENRLAIATAAFTQFRLRDWRGRRKSALPIPAGANCLLSKSGELWYGKVPGEALTVPPPPSKRPSKRQLEHLHAGLPVHHDDIPASQIDVQNAEYLRPLNQTGLLLKEFEILYPRLKRAGNLKDERTWQAEFPEIPRGTVKRWFVGRTPTPSDLALLVAARRAALAPSLGNLSSLRQMLADERRQRGHGKAGSIV